MKVLNDPVVSGAWNKLVEQQDLVNSVYMPALKAILKKNGIIEIGTFYHDHNDLYRPRNKLLTILF